MLGLRAAALTAVAVLAAALGAAPSVPGATARTATPAATQHLGEAAARPAEPSWRVQRSWQVAGRVLATRIVGDTVIVGGRFGAAISPDGGRVAVHNIAAFRLSTGELITGFRASTDGVVRSLAVSGSTLWIGGYFHTVNGVGSRGAAKLDLASGSLDRRFAPRLNHGVEAMALTGGSLVVGGRFTRVGTAVRRYVARLDSETGRVARKFNARIRGQAVHAIALGKGRRIWVGGSFRRVRGTARAGLVSLDARTGRPYGRQPAKVRGAIYTIAVAPRSGAVTAGGSANRLVAWRPKGAVRWVRRARGDIQAVRLQSGRLYVGVHDGIAGRRQARLFAVEARSGRLMRWHPRIPDYWGIYAIDVSRHGMAVGGRITSVNGVPTRGWARFLP